LAVTDAAGEPRELHVVVDEDSGVVSITVFHGTEHALIPLYPAPAKELARWLVEHVGLPPGLEFRGGRLTDA
jgi:hypothetical protein